MIKKTIISKPSSFSMSGLSTQFEIIGKSGSCDIPPKTLNWNGQLYYLSNSDIYSEPGIKAGYSQCINGDFVYAIDDGGPDHFIIYTNGVNDYELMIFGKWGKALYSPHPFS